MIGPMNIVVSHGEAGAGKAWRQALALHLPQAAIGLDPGTPDGAEPGAAQLAPAAAEIAVGWKPPADFFERHRHLKAFFSCGAGVDHLLAHPGLPQGLPLYRLLDAGMGACMADYCLHALLEIAGHHRSYAAQQAAAQWSGSHPLPRSDLPVGILGMGVLGEQVARALMANGFTVCGYTRTPRTHPSIPMMSGPGQWKAFLAASRVLILLAPHTPQTRDLIDARALAALPVGAWLINIARGALVVDDDLIAALDRHHLAGAVLDVFRQEPLPAAHRFWHHPRIRVTPHISGPTLLGPSAEQVATGIAALARGAEPDGRVDPQRGY